MSASAEVNALPGGDKLSGFQRGVVALCWSLVFLDGFDFQAVSYSAPALAVALRIEKPTLGPVFSAAVLGLALGALFCGALADKWGRKKVFVGCGILFGAATLATPQATTLTSLLAWRLLAGLGLGGATPIAITITADFCPKRFRSSAVIVMYSGFAIGGVASGWFAAEAASLGWKAVFYFGGAMAIGVAILIATILPEYKAPSEGGGASRFPLVNLFKNGFAVPTSLLWSVFVTSLIAVYFYLNWLPTLLTDAGLTPRRMVAVNTAGQIGGLAGAIVLAKLLISFAPYRVITTGYVLSAGLFAAIYIVGSNYASLLLLNLLLGVFLLGTQYGLNAASAELYPSESRAAGVGSAIGIGRFGGMFGPVLAGMLLAWRWPAQELFLFAAVPAVAAALSALALSRVGIRLAAVVEVPSAQVVPKAKRLTL